MIGSAARRLAVVLTLGLSMPALAADPPYEAMLQRLAEVLGSLHYLSGLCDGAGSIWREQMQGLIDAEEPEEARRIRLIDRFNVGYTSFASVYRSCTPAARAAAVRYRAEGAGLAGEISARFGPVTAPAAAPR